jgi:hypothetical protein
MSALTTFFDMVQLKTNQILFGKCFISIFCQFSMIKKTLNLKNGINIEKVLKLCAFKKRQNDGYTPKKSRVLTKEQVDRFWNFAPDSK